MTNLLNNAISIQGIERSGKRLVLASFIYIVCTIQAQGQTQEPFVTTWELIDDGNPFTNEELGITIPTRGNLTYAYTVDWGDDTTDTTIYTGNATHNYSAAGTYTVSISGDFPAIYFNNQSSSFSSSVRDNNSDKIKTIKSWGTQQWSSLAHAFAGCRNLTIEDGAGVPDLTTVTSMYYAFQGATSFNEDLSSWDVSNVTDMQSTFERAASFNGDLSSWNVSNVTSMRNTFWGATNFNSDLSSWNVSNVSSMYKTFWGATNFNSDLSSWNVSNVRLMWEMFSYARSFNQDLSSWNVSKVERMSSMFLYAESFNQDLSSWNVSSVRYMSSMFNNAVSFNQDLSSWDVSSVEYMVDMFEDATSFSAENYDALLTGWSSLPSLQNDVTFGAPPTTYCAGKSGRDILRSTYNWYFGSYENSRDNGQDCSQEDLSLSIKVFLQGAYDTNSKMNASLLTAGDQDTNIIPTTSPYGDGATVESTVFDITTGDNAIVDWVQVSLHYSDDVSNVISTKPALLQRDGDVVALDGSSGLQIQGIAGYYKVSINHRNHIPVIQDAKQILSVTETAIDFTNDLTIVTGGSNAMAEVATGIYALFSGDVDENNQVQVDDYNDAIQDIGRGGYLISDINMNGETQVDDINLILETLGKGAQF